MIKCVITLDELNKYSNVDSAINYAKTIAPSYPTSPVKPILKNNHTAEDVLVYAAELKQYELVKEQYNKDKELFYEEDNKHNAIVIDYIKERAGLYDIPINYRKKVWTKAWEDGHANGFYSVYQKLDGLVDLFL